jgi:RNA polymerase sigma-70 factor (ECF subfamily)
VSTEDDSPHTRDRLDRARHGDDAAVTELFAEYRARVRRAVALRLDRRLAARLDVSDVLQETFLEASRRLPEYLRQRPLPFGLWLCWLAREKVIALHRQHLDADKRAVAREAPPLPADASSCFVQALAGREPSPSQIFAAEEAAERLRLALSRLDDDERDLILWRHFEQLTNGDIARLLNVSDAAAAKRYVRALERLRGLLLGLGVTESG